MKQPGIESRNQQAMMLSGLKRIRIIHRLRVAMALLGFLALLAAVGGLWWANHTGLPDSWRTKIEQALANQGIHADVASLRYLPLRGIQAGEVVVYADHTRSRVFARLHELMLDVDRAHLSRGEVKIDRIDLAGARISLSADPEVPDSKTLEITDARGGIIYPAGRHLEIQNASGMIGGVRLELDGILEMYKPRPNPTPEEMAYSRAQRKQVLTSVIDSLENWGPKSSSPPRVRIRVNGDLEDFTNLRADIEVQGAGFKSHSLEINSVNLRAELRGPLIVVHHADIRTSTGNLAGRLEYDIWKRRGRFEMNSNLDLAALITSLDLPMPEKMPSFGKPPIIEAHGTFAQHEAGMEQQIMGKVELDHPAYAHYAADRVSTLFSWDGKQLFLEDLEVLQGENELTGRVFIAPDKILYEARTDLLPSYWQKMVEFEPLSSVLDHFSQTEETTASVDFKGRSNLLDRLDWSFKGEAAATSISYDGVPAKRAKVTLDLNRDRQDFIDGEVEFDYRDYPLRKAHGGPLTGNIKVDLIRYDREPNTVTIRKLRGAAWPGPIARTFAPGLATTLEAYGFHSNPGLEADGVIGIGNGLSKQDFTVQFATNERADYKFLGTVLELESPRGKVRVLPKTVKISNLGFGLFDGRFRGKLETPTSGDKTITGEVDWTAVSISALSKAYDFKKRPKGQVTGRLDFNLRDEDVTRLNGNGHIALENGELFEVPIFGPLSPVISTVLGRRKAGFQEAGEAFCTFDLEDGILTTLDFKTATSSIVFTGDALVNLSKQTLRMTLRMNARGLFGVITLPLRPFYGIFQFRGTGPIREPVWTNVMFTKPPKQQEKTLLEPPKARQVNPPSTE